MADYLYSDDGNIHTRFSELASCTIGSIEKVLDVREGLIDRWTNENVEWGRDRHEMWAEESQKTGFTPQVFDVTGWRLPVIHIEKEFATEIFGGVTVHSRPDAVGEDFVVDYKTLASDNLKMGRIKATATYSRSRQLKFYAYQLGLHGFRIRKGVYLVEIWDKEYKEILGYHAVIQEFSFKEIGSVLPWVQDKISLLVAAYDERQMVEV